MEKEYERKLAEAEAEAGAVAASGEGAAGGGMFGAAGPAGPALSESLEPEVRNNEVIRDMLKT